MSQEIEVNQPVINELGDNPGEKTRGRGVKNTVSSNKDNLVIEVSMEDVVDERCLNISTSKRKKSDDKGQGGG